MGVLEKIVFDIEEIKHVYGLKRTASSDTAEIGERAKENACYDAPGTVGERYRAV